MSATLTPGICLLIDMILNKIRIPTRHLLINLIFQIIYVSLTFLGQILYKYPIYANKIAWDYNLDNSIAVVDNSSGNIYQNCQNGNITCYKNCFAKFYSNFKKDSFLFLGCKNYNLNDTSKL